MKFKGMLIAAMLLIAALALAGCAPAPAPAPTAAPEATATPDPAAAPEPTAAPEATTAPEAASGEAPALELTAEELAAYDGKDGRKAYVAVNGTIYEVTDVGAWAGGQHNGNVAGKDLTDAIKNSPHGERVLEKLTVVGKLK